MSKRNLILIVTMIVTISWVTVGVVMFIDLDPEDRGPMLMGFATGIALVFAVASILVTYINLDDPPVNKRADRKK